MIHGRCAGHSLCIDFFFHIHLLISAQTSPTMKLLPTLSALVSFAAYIPPIVADSVCSTGLYAALAPLETYPPAVSYCQGQAGKVTVTVTASAAQRLRKRASKSSATSSATSANTKTTATTPVKTSTTSTTENAKASAWSSLVAQAKQVVATFCSCAGYPATVTVCCIILVKGLFINSTQTTVKPTPTPPCGGTCPNGCQCLQSYPGGSPGPYKCYSQVINVGDCVYFLLTGDNVCGSYDCVIAPGQGSGESQSACAVSC